MKVSFRRFKFLGLLSLALLISIPFLVFAFGEINSPGGGFTSYKSATSTPIFHYTDNSLTTVSTIPDCIQNSSTSNDYFIPTRSITEWNAFINNRPSSLAMVLCPGQCDTGTCCNVPNKSPLASGTLCLAGSFNEPPKNSCQRTATNQNCSGTPLVQICNLHFLT